MIELFLSIAMLGVAALAVGGVVILRRGERKRGWLMLGAAAVLFGNVLILALP